MADAKQLKVGSMVCLPSELSPPQWRVLMEAIRAGGLPITLKEWDVKSAQRLLDLGLIEAIN